MTADAFSWRTVVLDDDPTGTQASVNVTIILDPDPSFLSAWKADRRPGTVFVSTDTRAMSGAKAMALAAKIVSLVVFPGNVGGNEVLAYRVEEATGAPQSCPSWAWLPLKEFS